jgi:KUP system potassium uptake protein
VSDVEVNPERRPVSPKSGVRHGTGAAALTFGALGVVFGDIGTSPLYAIQTVFSADNHAVHPTQATVYGIISLVFWTITLVVSVKYVTFIMRADNEGEGGIMALIALVQSISLKGRWTKMGLVALGIVGASLFYGDGMITPAISVLSAVEGLKVAAPSLGHLVVLISVGVLTVLFAIQRLGTHAVGRLFGPVMGVWFGVIALAGVNEVAAHPAILKALSPTYAIQFMEDHGGVAFIALGSVVLAVTGAEALYADMGHFGAAPIRRAWFFAVFPALTLNYLGQGSLIIGSKKAIDNPFFLLIPHWGRFPMVLLATIATVIASQALISGAFSVTRQAVQLGFLPRMTIRHTSEEEEGQVYAPAVNAILFIGVVAIVIGFGSSARLASAYGIAVTGTFVVTTLLFFVVVRRLWNRPLWMVVLGGGAFLTVDLAFFSANLTKVAHGGWFPLSIAAVAFTVLITWQRGREIVTRKRTEEEGPLREFVEQVREMDPPVYRSPGTAVFLNANRETTPLALRTMLDHLRVLPENVVIMSIETLKVPHQAEDERVEIDDLGYGDDGISHVAALYGFQDVTNVPAALRLSEERGLESHIDTENPSYFLSKITIIPTDAPGMAKWRKRLFVAISRNSASPVELFRIPDDQTVILGSHIEL